MKNTILFIFVAFSVMSFYASATAQTCSNPTLDLPDTSEPVDGTVLNAYCVDFTFDPAITGIPAGLSIDLVHSFEGDLGIFVAACGNTLNVMQRPGAIGNCEGGAPFGSTDAVGTPPAAQVTLTFTDAGIADPEDGIGPGGDFGITADDACGVGLVKSTVVLQSTSI